MPDQSAGDILRAERVRQRLTLAQAGRLAGYSASTLSRIERGERRLDVDALWRLAERYGIRRISWVWLLSPIDTAVIDTASTPWSSGRC